MKSPKFSGKNHAMFCAFMAGWSYALADKWMRRARTDKEAGRCPRLCVGWARDEWRRYLHFANRANSV